MFWPEAASPPPDAVTDRWQGCLLGASVEMFTDRTAWESAAGPLETIGFDHLAPAGGCARFDSRRGLQRSGARFTGRGLEGRPHSLAVVSALGHAHVSAWGPCDKLQSGGCEIRIQLPPGTTAVGLYVMVSAQAFVPAGASFTVKLSAGDVFENLVSTPPPDRAFVGFASRQPIAWIELVSSASFAMIDGVSLGRRS